MGRNNIMKKKISLLLAILMLVTLIPTAFAESKAEPIIMKARKTSQKLTVDGKEVNVGFYNIQGSNYIKLRDLAAILKDTDAKFSVAYDEGSKSFIIERYRAYEKVKGDLEAIKNDTARAIISIKDVLINYSKDSEGVYEKRKADTALINGSNYLKLRDLADLAGFSIGFEEKTKTINIISKYQSDDTYDGFLRKEFTEEEEKTFDKIEKLYLALADNDKNSANNAIKELMSKDMSDEDSNNFQNQIINGLKLKGISELKKDYKAEKVIEDYDDGDAYMFAFNLSDSFIAINYFVPNSDGQGAELLILSNKGSDYTKGSLHTYYLGKELTESLTIGNVYSLHSNIVNKKYDEAFKNYQNLNLNGDKNEMIQFFEKYKKDNDVLHDKYTYERVEFRFHDSRGEVYTFDYGTEVLLKMSYSMGRDGVTLSVEPIKKDKVGK